MVLLPCSVVVLVRGGGGGGGSSWLSYSVIALLPLSVLRCCRGTLLPWSVLCNSDHWVVLPWSVVALVRCAY